MSGSLKERQQKVLELLDSCGSGLYALLVRLTLCEETAGDLMQELFLRLSDSKGFGKADNGFAYAYRTAINLAFDKRRRKAKEKFCSLDENSLKTKDDSVLQGLVNAEELTEVLDAMMKLNKPARDVVVMHYIEQMPYADIARLLGKKTHHIRSVSSKAIGRLRQMLNSNPTRPDAKERSYG